MIKLRFYLTSSALIATLASAMPAKATGTQAGTTITNSVTVDYDIGGINQDDATASTDIVVDRKVDLIVARTDNSATLVTPGATMQAVTFQVSNISNDTLDFQLGATQVATGGAAGISGVDAFDATTPLTLYLDDGDGVFDSGDTAVTHLDALAPDTPVVVHVVAAAVPTGLTTNAIAAVSLSARARANDNGTALGSALTQASTNTAGVDTIFADGAGSSDSARDATYTAIDDFKVLAAAISATKTSSIVAGDFGTGAAIPGATIQYCIAVTNAAGGAAASNLAISDTLSPTVTYDASYGVKVGGVDCASPGSGGGNYSSGTVSGTIASLTAGATQTVIFRAVIN